MKKSAKGDIVLCFPGESHWELWTREGEGELKHPTGKEYQASSPTEFRGVTHFAFPISRVTCSPFWAASDDSELLPSLAEMRLESFGIRPDSGMGQHLDYTVIDHGENRTLLQTVVLAEGRGMELPRGDAEVFDISTNCLPFPRNHLVLWRELDRWVVVMTRKGKPVYFQGLNSDDIDAGAVLELKCLLLQLHSQGIIEELSGAVIWGVPLDPEARALFEEELELSVLIEPRPAPLLPEDPLDLLPREVAQHRSVAARRQKIKNWVLVGAGVYVVVAALLVGRNFYQETKNSELRQALVQMEREVGWIEPTSMRWESLQDAIQVDRYPLEIFRIIHADLPESGIRITDININAERITIAGEASSLGLARNFLTKLKVNSLLNENYDWDNEQPKEDKAGAVSTFVATGKYRYGTSQA